MPSPLRTHHRDFDAARLAEERGDTTVAVCLPARDEADTVGAIVETIRRDLIERVHLVDELVVADDHSTDATAATAAAAGATVVDVAMVTDGAGTPARGKGAALWTSLHETSSTLVVWIDADLQRFGSHFVTGLVGTLLARPDIGFVKGRYQRPLVDGEGGGRVTELLARPVIATLFPELGTIAQPLSGEYGGRRRLLERLPFVTGYGVDLALLVDVTRTAGLEALAEVDLGERIHRNRPIDQLGPQATEVLQAGLRRAGLDVAHPAVLRRPGRDPLFVAHQELPPLVDLASYPASA